MAFAGIYCSKRVFITGHTGFKGSWLTQWLLELGADVVGYSLPAPTKPAMFDQIGIQSQIHHIEGDVRDLAFLRKSISEFRPDFVFHLAAQSLVRSSYEQPVDTFSTNIMGTVNVLEAVRLESQACIVVIVTTDKCYENKEWLHSYREEDPMGGYDPYSSSKGAAELVVAAYRRSYFTDIKSGIRLVSVRAGNVIGGGDWALDRIVPDCIRSLTKNENICVRNKISTRPWQHVLEPLSGYLWLGACLQKPELVKLNNYLNSSFNFGPELNSNKTVAELVEEILKYWPGVWVDKGDPQILHEAKLLNLSIDKAYHVLQWKPTLDFQQAIQYTVSWYRNSVSVAEYTKKQISSYTRQAHDQMIAWAK